jgi:cephalosporin hydroxylase
MANRPLRDVATIQRSVALFAEERERAIQESQRGVPTFFDMGLELFAAFVANLDASKSWEDTLANLDDVTRRALGEGLEWLECLQLARARGRFVPPAERRARPSSDIGLRERLRSQGVAQPMHWKGMPLFKTVQDVCIYQMLLWDLRPKTIVEIGSGSGASAVWLADLAGCFGLDCHIYSLDIERPTLTHDRVTFLQADCNEIERVVDEQVDPFIRAPCLLIEDAHVNVVAVLSHFHGLMRKGDYVFIEDTATDKAGVVEELTRAFPDCYLVDTHYTDYFGHNATCAPDTILVRTR